MAKALLTTVSKAHTQHQRNLVSDTGTSASVARHKRSSAGLPVGAGFSLIDTPIWVQPKLEIGPVDDPLEHEADRVADQVMRMPDGSPALEAEGARLSRKCACQEDEDDQSEPLQAKASGKLVRDAGPTVQRVLSSPGRPMDPATRGFFEPRFGRNFSDVRVHTDAAAGESARSINALGYTVGSDVVFAQGQYSPHTSAGRQLLAHELAHVVQQSSGGVVRRAPDTRESWKPGIISAGIGVIASGDASSCITSTNIRGDNQICANFSGKPGDQFDCRSGEYASGCLFPCVGRPLNFRPMFWVDSSETPRPQPFDPPRLSMRVWFYPDAGDADLVTRETSAGQYAGPGWPLKTGFSDLTFFTPDSPGTLIVSLVIADSSAGEVAVYSDSIPVKTCPVVAMDPEPEVAEPETPEKGRQTRFNIEVQDPDEAPLVYQLVGSNTPLEGPGGFFAVWQDQAGNFYYLNNGRRVHLPNFSPP